MSLAKELGKTLRELDEAMDEAELRLWMAYSEWERKQVENS
jgi:hypothetical protein